ncbi:MAG: CinA family nicotinamide mononucleotide deamidase-related protein [Bdellovibrionales bacterium]|nr:CinA family nicotinamide mononucleotide deamidase-related protein [Bdellovibrionales bacterium]
MNPQVAILSIGNEVVDGRIINTNASWLSQEFIKNGITPTLVTSCRDDETEIVQVLQYLSAHADFIITSGGLGPTSDDLTRHAIAQFINKPLVLNEEELGRLKHRYKLRGRKFDNSNNIQAHFPEGSTIIPNPTGTAPGFITSSSNRSTMFSLPGVPSEFRTMVLESVIPDLLHRLGSSARVPSSVQFHLFGIPESEAGKKVSLLRLPKAVRVGYRPSFPVLEIRLETVDSLEELTGAESVVREALLDFIFSEEKDGSLPKTIHQLLCDNQKTIAVAESCTGGYLGKLLTERGGSSTFFLGGALTYSNEMKTKLLGVPKELLQKFGAVSPEVATAMAKGAHTRFGSDIAVSITGIAGPDGGSEEKPVGLFYLGIASAGYEVALRFFLPTTREYVRRYAAFAALDSIRRYLLGLPYLGKTAEITE